MLGTFVVSFLSNQNSHVVNNTFKTTLFYEKFINSNEKNSYSNNSLLEFLKMTDEIFYFFVALNIHENLHFTMRCDCAIALCVHKEADIFKPSLVVTC